MLRLRGEVLMGTIFIKTNYADTGEIGEYSILCHQGPDDRSGGGGMA